MAEQYQTRLAEVLNEAMKKQRVSIRDLALATGVTYEHIRRCVRGINNPATPLLRLICGYLELDEAEMAQYAAADELERKFGDVPALLADKNPEMTMIERHWVNLTAAQKTDLTNLARDWAHRNRENA